MKDYVSDSFGRPKTVQVEVEKKSGGALRALVCSLAFFLPVVPLVGAVLGILAIRKPSERRGLATMAIVFGVLFTVVQGFAAMSSYGLMQQVRSGPQAAIETGLQGDVASFAAQFGLDSDRATLVSAEAFLDELRTRYGALHEVEPVGVGFASALSDPGALRSYTARFENATVRIDAGFSGQRLANRLRFVEVCDDDRGRLAYPGSATPSAVVQNPDTH